MLPQCLAERQASELSATGDVKMRTEVGVMYLQAKECQKLPGTTTRWKRQEKYPVKLLSGSYLDRYGRTFQNHERINFCSCKLPSVR